MLKQLFFEWLTSHEPSPAYGFPRIGEFLRGGAFIRGLGVFVLRSPVEIVQIGHSSSLVPGDTVLAEEAFRDEPVGPVSFGLSQVGEAAPFKLLESAVV
jgi:hypothetical protein